MMTASFRCPACRSPQARQTLRIPDHEYALNAVATYAQCAECLSFYQHPMPDLPTLASYYPRDYHSFDASSFITTLKHGQRLKNLLKLMKRPDFTMLDYGCGNGAFLHYAAKKLPRSRFIGYEIADAKEVKKDNNDRVIIIKGNLGDLLSELPNMDLISMHHVIEHLPDPFYTINALYKKLNVNGVFVGQTPAADSLEYEIFKKRWAGFHAPRHTVIFSKAGVTALLKRIGFNPAQATGAFNPGGISVSLASLPHGDGPGRIKRSGFKWLFYVGLAILLYPIDLLSGKPGIMNFYGKKSRE